MVSAIVLALDVRYDGGIGDGDLNAGEPPSGSMSKGDRPAGGPREPAGQGYLRADIDRQGDLDRRREIVVRSLAWMVSAVVAGLIKDVTLATPPVLCLADVADQSGCNLVEADDESARMVRAMEASRCDHILIMRSGFQPEAGLAEEIGTLLRNAAPSASAFLHAAPATFWQRLFPDRTPVVGLLLPRSAARAGATFDRLVESRRGRVRLRSRAYPIG